LVFACLMFIATGCTANERARNFGGTQTIDLPAGKKLVNATWKETNLWYLLRPMQNGESPDTLNFIESSAYGMMNGAVIFIEHAAAAANPGATQGKK